MSLHPRKAAGASKGLRTEILDASGEIVPVSLSASLIYEGETPVGIVGIFTDLREKMRMEQRLQQAQEQLIAQERQADHRRARRRRGARAQSAAHERRHVYATLLRR